MSALLAFFGFGPATSTPTGPEDLTVPLVAAVEADLIVDGQGVCLNQGPDYADDKVVRLMGDCKIRHVRNGTYVAAAGPLQSQRNLLGGLGIRFLNQFTESIDTTINEQITFLLAHHPEYQEVIANRNEPNPVSNPGDWAQTAQAGDGDAGDCSAFQIRKDLRNLWTLTRASADLKTVTIAGGVFSSFRKAGWYAALAGNAGAWNHGAGACNAADNHLYFGGDVPFSNATERAYVVAGGEYEDLVGAGKPSNISETGYHTAQGMGAVSTWTYFQKYYAGTHKGTPEDVVGTYVARYPWIWRSLAPTRDSRYYLFKLSDEPAARGNQKPRFFHEKQFGLVNSDGTPKPAWKAICCTNQLCVDPGPQFTTTGLRVKATLADGTAVPSSATFVMTVAEKRDGSWVVCLMRTAPVLDNSTYRSAIIKVVGGNDPLTQDNFVPGPDGLPQYDVDNTRTQQKDGKPIPGTRLTVNPINIKVTFSKARQVAVYQPVSGTAPITPTATVTTITVPLDGDVKLLQVTPVPVAGSLGGG